MASACLVHKRGGLGLQFKRALSPPILEGITVADIFGSHFAFLDTDRRLFTSGRSLPGAAFDLSLAVATKITL